MAWLCPPVSTRVLSTSQTIPVDISIDRDLADAAAASPHLSPAISSLSLPSLHFSGLGSIESHPAGCLFTFLVMFSVWFSQGLDKTINK